jgi:S-DNA-T family DNA segregation ATPase FtsK/SpoIIIE
LAAKGKPPVKVPDPPLAERTLPAIEGIRVKSRASTYPNGSSSPAPASEVAPQGILSYLDEIGGFLLIAVGLISFLTLLSPASGTPGAAWSGALRQAFGMGAFIISAAVLLAGALLLAPKIGIPVRFNWRRVVGAELFFVFLLAYLHAGIRASIGGEAGKIEAFARAMDGQGGGYVGWAIQELIHMLLGDVVTGLLLLALLVLSAGMMVGTRRQDLIGGLDRLQSWLTNLADRLEGRSPSHSPAAESSGPMRASSPRLAAEDELTEAEAEGEPPADLASKPPLDPNSPIVVELPPIPGRPSILTGQTGAGAVMIRRPGPAPIRISSLKRHLVEEGLDQDDEVIHEIKYRFTLKEQPDRKKLAKRSPELPPLDLLDTVDFERPSEEEININAQIIEETAEDFGMKVEVIGVKAGPTVTQYAVRPYTEVELDGRKVVQRVRVTRVAGLAKDLSLALAAPSVRIQAPVPGTNYIGIEVPNARPGIVSLRPIIESERFYKIRSKSALAVALGREVDGKPFCADLGSMPHLLIGGTTGSGKSVCLRALATCLVTNNRPDELRLIMIDPKMVELIRFNGLPHLLGKVEVELDRIIGVLRWVTREMDRRYRLMEEAQARNIAAYNHGRRRAQRLPYMVVLIDELAELMTEYPDETEHLITRLAQMARATGIHLVVATQRPSTDIVTGLIKANFPARISFAVASGVDSRVILDSVGAEDLIGKGDMLFQAADAAGPIRLQGCFVSDREMERIVEFWCETWKGEGEAVAPWEPSLTRAAVLEETDQMLEEAIRVVQMEGEASTSLLQRKLNVSYPRAGRLMDALYRLGVVGEPQAGGRTRRVLIGSNVDPTTYIVEWRKKNR